MRVITRTLWSLAGGAFATAVVWSLTALAIGLWLLIAFWLKHVFGITALGEIALLFGVSSGVFALLFWGRFGAFDG